MDSCKKLFKYLTLSFILISILISCSDKSVENKTVLSGADVLLSERLDLIRNKNLGIITNHTAILTSGVHLVDTLFSRNDVQIRSLFGPEHGIRGNAPDGHSIMDGIDSKTGLPVYSLYGKTKKPTQLMLDSLDLLIFDIQDIGARFYTFISTMYYAIQTAAENDIPIIILDRPNPINGSNVEGPLLDLEFKSFVGIAKIPIRHGMTVGELAQMFNQETILGTDVPAKLEIVKIKNWARESYFDKTQLKWIKPSPNMPTLETAIAYPGICLLEGTNISEGRGTYSPFLQFGSPFINSNELINELESQGISGCKLDSVEFTPVSIENMSTNPKYKNEKCFGIKLSEIDKSSFAPVEFGIKLIYTLHKLYSEELTFRYNWIDKLWGSKKLRESIELGKTPSEIINDYQSELKDFKKYRKQFLLY